MFFRRRKKQEIIELNVNPLRISNFSTSTPVPPRPPASENEGPRDSNSADPLGIKTILKETKELEEEEETETSIASPASPAMDNGDVVYADDDEQENEGAENDEIERSSSSDDEDYGKDNQLSIPGNLRETNFGQGTGGEKDGEEEEGEGGRKMSVLPSVAKKRKKRRKKQKKKKKKRKKALKKGKEVVELVLSEAAPVDDRQVQLPMIIEPLSPRGPVLDPIAQAGMANSIDNEFLAETEGIEGAGVTVNVNQPWMEQNLFME